jgi:hypothetical protein
MSTSRSPILTNDPRLFGRRQSVAPVTAIEARPESFGGDLRLFTMTFVAGFLFVSIFLG